MALLTFTLNVPAIPAPPFIGTIVGAPTDITAAGKLKSIKIDLPGGPGSFTGSMTFEVSLDGGTTWVPLAYAYGTEQIIERNFAATHIRIVRTVFSFGPFAAPDPVVTLGCNDDGTVAIAIPVAVNDASTNNFGAAVDISALGSFNSLAVVNNSGRDAHFNFEFSDDGVNWTSSLYGLFQTQPALRSRVFGSRFIRGQVNLGNILSPVLPPPGDFVANLAAINDPSASGSGGGSGGLGLVFQPGGGGAGPVFFDTWADLMTQLGTLRTNAGGNLPIDIFFDDSNAAITIPAGTHEMENVTWRAYRGELDLTSTLIVLAQNTVLPNLLRFQGPMDIRWDAGGSSPVELDAFDVINMEDTEIQANVGGSAAFFDGTGLGAGDNVSLIMVRSQLAPNAADAVLEVANANISVFINMDNQSRISADALTVPAAADVRGRWLGLIADQANVVTFNGPGGGVNNFGHTWLVTLTSSTPLSGDRFNQVVGIDASGGAKVVNLPVISPKNEGQQIVIKETSGAPTGAITVTPNAGAGDTIEGAADFDITIGFESVTIVSDGVGNWMII